jgi:hypothetical protein
VSGEGTPLLSWTAEALAAWAQLLTLIAAVAAARIAILQIKESKQVSREAEAQQSFREYLKLLIEQKDLVEKKDPDDHGYHYLVVFMLSTFEKIYDLSKADKYWLATMDSHVVEHRAYLVTLDEVFYSSFNSDFASFVAGALKRKPQVAP